jgi:zinc protease
MGLVYNVYSTFNATLGEGPWFAALGTNPDNVDKATAALKAEVIRMRDKGATQEEVQEAIQFITGYFPITLETNGGVGDALLNAEFYGLGLNYIYDLPKIYRSVTLEQVNAAAKKYLHPDRATLAIVGPYEEGKQP